jgi:hypothetical protein
VGRSAPARASKNIIREQLFARARLRAIEWANPDDRSGRLQAGSYERHASWRDAVTNMHNCLQQRRNRDPSGKASPSHGTHVLRKSAPARDRMGQSR